MPAEGRSLTEYVVIATEDSEDSIAIKVTIATRQQPCNVTEGGEHRFSDRDANPARTFQST